MYGVGGLGSGQLGAGLHDAGGRINSHCVNLAFLTLCIIWHTHSVVGSGQLGAGLHDAGGQSDHHKILY
jgi:phosphoribosylaminoimidazole carboxylase (NCAIR synthetase)